ncbi:MAG: FtsX-like permease family protein [Sandaracinaceae bacterium]|nr:FtsX-like permease family protein [Sandaracinaceae bacterium]
MSPLDRKLFRNLWTLAGQGVTIALVVAAGIATYVCLQGTYRSLIRSRDTYYERNRFGEVFATVSRAPLSVADRVEAIEGVARVYPRVTDIVSLPFDDEPEPAAGQIIGIPASGQQPPLNGIVLMSGRWPEPGHSEEVLLLSSFAEARGIGPGDSLDVILNGSRRALRVVGTALSPEFVFAMEPGNAMPEPNKFAVIWMFEDAVRAAFQLGGAFTDLVVTLQPGASELAVIDALDRLLEPYGGFGAVGRELQPSNYFLSQEIGGLENLATIAPIIFLAVAAFLLNVVLSRLIHLQRPQIAALKALGYDDWAIGFHFLKLVTAVVMLGALIGVGLGAWLGQAMTQMYTQWFQFPSLEFHMDAQLAILGVAVSLGAAVLGAAFAVRSVVRLPPAEAMRPPPPARYTRSLLERLGVFSLFGTSARMVFREITRRPMRNALSALGISMAVAIMVVGRFGGDAFEQMIDVTFQTAMTEDLAVGFTGPMPDRVVRELAHLPGVSRAEGMRMVPVRFSNGHRHRDSVIEGHPDDLTLRTLYDMDGSVATIPREGVLLEGKLAEILGLRVGDMVTVQVREGQRGTYQVPVTGLIDTMYGLQGYMQIDTINRLLSEGRTVSYVLLDVDPARMDEVIHRLRDMRGVHGINSRTGLIERVRGQTGETYGAMTFILTLFAVTIAIGVVYNNARVALSLRARDLASLRVLGFTRAEISSVLLGELAVQVLLAIPLGLWLGVLMSEGMMATADPERYRLPVAITSQTFAFAAAVTMAAGLVSALLVRRKLDKLDLIGVLKTRD